MAATLVACPRRVSVKSTHLPKITGFWIKFLSNFQGVTRLISGTAETLYDA